MNGYVALQTPLLCTFVHMTDRLNNLFRIYLFIYLMFLAFDNHSRLLPVVGRMHSNLYSWVVLKAGAG